MREKNRRKISFWASFVMAGMLMSSPPLEASDWARTDLYTRSANSRFFVDLDSLNTQGEEVFCLMRMVRPDESFMELALSVQCREKIFRIAEVSEFDNQGRPIAHYLRSQYKLEMKEDEVLEIFRLAACEDDRAKPVERIRELKGLREYVLKKGKKRKQ